MLLWPQRKARSAAIMKLTKKRIIIISAIVLVLFGGLITFWVWQAQGGRFFAGSGSSTKKKDVPQYTEDKQQDLIDEVNKKQGTGDYEGAITLLEGQQNAGDAKNQLLLAGAYATAGKLKEALDIYKKLDEDGKLPDTELENMAATADRAKEYQLALDTYKRAKEYAVSSGTQTDDQIKTYDYLIAELEKKL
jgi:pentatricopeptide repeat protein